MLHYLQFCSTGNGNGVLTMTSFHIMSHDGLNLYKCGAATACVRDSLPTGLAPIGSQYVLLICNAVWGATQNNQAVTYVDD